MNASFQQTLVDVWRQVLVENASVVGLGGKSYSVRITPRKNLRQVDFMFDGNEIRGLEQNPETASRWAQLARSGKKLMQFLSEGQYVAVVVDGKTVIPIGTTVQGLSLLKPPYGRITAFNLNTGGVTQ